MSGQELTRLRIMIDLADSRLTVKAAAALRGYSALLGFEIGALALRSTIMAGLCPRRMLELGHASYVRIV